MSSRGTIDVSTRRGHSARRVLLALGLLLSLALAGSASAATITYTSVIGIWHDPTDNVPGVQPGDPVITNGNPTSIIRWGTTNGTPHSGYDVPAA